MVAQRPLTPPAEFAGSMPEFIVLQELRKLGKQEGMDFTYQAVFFDGTQRKGGLVADFVFYDPPGLAINVQGVYFHYEFGPETRAHDLYARAQLAGEGITLIFIDEDHLLQDPSFYVREALAFRDHSRLGR